MVGDTINVSALSSFKRARTQNGQIFLGLEDPHNDPVALYRGVQALRGLAFSVALVGYAKGRRVTFEEKIAKQSGENHLMNTVCVL